ncbi:MAG: hypothetical protein ACK4XM_12745 [Chloroherpetonaceae bacterium]
MNETKKDLRLLRFAGNVIVKRVKDNLKREGYTEGSQFFKWRPLAKSTLEQKKRAGYPTRILEREGDMRRLFGYTTLDRVLRITSEDYFIYHQYGTKRMPKRKVVTIASEDLEKIRAKFANVLKEKMRKYNEGRVIKGFKKNVVSKVKTRLEGEFE